MKLKKNNNINSIDKLIELDIKEAERVFNKMSINEKIETVLNTAWEKRLDIIFVSTD